MIRVLHYLRHLDLGGTAKTCQLFFENASKDFEVILVHEAMGDKIRLEEFQKAARVSGGKIIEIDSYNIKNLPDPKPLQEVIDTFKVDILHVYRSGYKEFPVGLVKVPHVVETNVFGFMDGDPAIDRSLFMSKWLMDYALKGMTFYDGHPLQNRFNFVNNPVEEPYEIGCLGVRIDWLSDNPNCIIVGRCGRPDNGIYNSVNVEAVRLLRMQGYDIRFLVMAPPSNMVADLLEYDIPFKIYEPTTNPIMLSLFYNSVDIYAHARADGETFGVNIAEAMMHGKPVVTHVATPSNPQMGVFQSQTELVDDKTTGFVCLNDRVNYMDALKLLIDYPELRTQMGDAGREKAMREYHADVCQRKLEQIYKEILND